MAIRYSLLQLTQHSWKKVFEAYGITRKCIYAKVACLTTGNLAQNIVTKSCQMRWQTGKYGSRKNGMRAVCQINSRISFNRSVGGFGIVNEKCVSKLMNWGGGVSVIIPTTLLARSHGYRHTEPQLMQPPDAFDTKQHLQLRPPDSSQGDAQLAYSNAPHAPDSTSIFFAHLKP